MKIKTLEDQFMFYPVRERGEALFEGEYHWDEDIARSIGQEGMEFIKNKIQTIIENKKEMFGEMHVSFYGLPSEINFYDLKNRILLDIKDAMLPENNIIKIRESLLGNHLKKMSNIRAYKEIRGIAAKDLYS